MIRRLLSTAAGAATAAAPQVALACPNCVGNTQYAGSQMLMLAGFAVLPFTLAVGVGLLVRRVSRD